jgi:uncharacterized protein YlxW (UPF0749 family)
MSFDLWPLLIPVSLAAVTSVATAWVVRRYAGPAQSAYVVALEGRVKILQSEREDLSKEVAAIEKDMEVLRVRIKVLQDKVLELERQVRVLTAENLVYLRADHAESVTAAAMKAGTVASEVPGHE